MEAVPAETDGGFHEPDSCGYTPLIQLCVCWYRLGDTQKAIACNERAGKLKPESKAYAHNKAFLTHILHTERAAPKRMQPSAVMRG